MTLANFLDYIKNVGSKDVYRVLSDLNASLEAWAKQLGFDAWILFLAGLVAAVVVGFFGYKMIKLLMGLGLAYVGYFVGVEIFLNVQKSLTWLPEWSSYIFGALVALLFMSLAVAKFSYAVYTAFALIGYCVTLFYTNNAVLAVGGAVIFAILSVSLIRTVFICMSSFVSALLSVAFLSKLLPALTFLQFGEGQWVSFGIAIALTLVYIAIQFAINRRRNEDGDEDEVLD